MEDVTFEERSPATQVQAQAPAPGRGLGFSDLDLGVSNMETRQLGSTVAGSDSPSLPIGINTSASTSTASTSALSTSAQRIDQYSQSLPTRLHQVWSSSPSHLSNPASSSRSTTPIPISGRATTTVIAATTTDAPLPLEANSHSALASTQASASLPILTAAASSASTCASASTSQSDLDKLPNPLLDVTSARMPSEGRGALHAGSIFRGTQTSGRSAYEVEVELQVCYRFSSDRASSHPPIDLIDSRCQFWLLVSSLSVYTLR